METTTKKSKAVQETIKRRGSRHDTANNPQSKRKLANEEEKNTITTDSFS